MRGRIKVLLVFLLCGAVQTHAQQADAARHKMLTQAVASNPEISWQNGKLILPKGDKKAFQANAMQALDTLRGNKGAAWLDSLNEFENVQNKGFDRESMLKKVTQKPSRLDSLGFDKEWLSKGSNWSDKMKWSGKNPEDLLKGEIYSDKKLKAIFDSLGLGRMDSLMAFASLKGEISEADMLQRINNSFGTSKKLQDAERLTTLSNTKLSPGSVSTLAPLSGMQLAPEKLKDPRYLMSRMATEMDKLKLNPGDSVNQEWRRQVGTQAGVFNKAQSKVDSLLTISESQSPSSIKRDSLIHLKHKYTKKLDSLESIKIKADSLMTAYSQLKAEWADRGKTKINEYKNVKNRYYRASEKESTPDLRNVVVSKKPGLLSPIYFEGLVSTFRMTKGNQEFYLSPGFGYEMRGGFSLGASPNIIVRPSEEKINVLTGYRLFAKYRIIRNLGYLQLEDVASPTLVGNDKLKQSVLLGVGGLLPMASKTAINIALLYRVNNVNSNSTNVSNWVFRIGISTIGNANTKK